MTVMKTLLLMRHAKSSWADSDLSDHDRPLNKRGKRDAPRMGAWIAEQGLIPDRVLHSTAKRAAATAAAMATECDIPNRLMAISDIYACSGSDWFQILQDFGDDSKCLLVVGHNPGIEDFLERVTGDYQRMPTAAIAQLELEIDQWRLLTEETPARLVDLWRPKDLWD